MTTPTVVLTASPDTVSRPAAPSRGGEEGTFRIVTLPINGVSRQFIVWVTSTFEKDGRKQTLLHKASDAAFETLAKDCVVPVLKEATLSPDSGQVNIQFSKDEAGKAQLKVEVTGSDSKSKTISIPSGLANTLNKANVVYQSFIENTKSSLVPAGSSPLSKPVKKIEPKTEKSPEKKPEAKKTNSTALDTFLENLDEKTTQLDSSSVIAGLSVLERALKSKIQLVRGSMRSGGSCCFEARSDAEDTQKLASLTLARDTKGVILDQFIPVRLGNPGDSGHFVAIRVRPNPKSFFDSAPQQYTIEYYNPLGNRIDSDERLTTSFDAFLTLNGIFLDGANRNATLTQSTAKDQNDPTQCGVHVLRHFESLVSGKKEADIVKYRTSFAERVRTFISTLSNKEKEGEGPRGFNSIPRAEIPYKAGRVEETPAVRFHSGDLLKYALTLHERLPVVITGNPLDIEEIRRRTTLSQCKPKEHEEMALSAPVVLKDPGNFYEPMNPSEIRRLRFHLTPSLHSEKFTDPDLTQVENALYSSLSHLKNRSGSRSIPVILSLPSAVGDETAAQMLLKPYVSILKLREFEGLFEVHFVVAEDAQRLSVERAWSSFATRPTAPAPVPTATTPAPTAPSEPGLSDRAAAVLRAAGSGIAAVARAAGNPLED